MTPSKFMAGYTLDPPVPKPNRRNSSKWDQIGHTLPWIDLSTDTHRVDGRGDLVTGDAKESNLVVTAWNEQDKLRYKRKKHKYFNPKSGERTPEEWWTGVVMPAVSPLYDWLRRERVSEKNTWGIVARCFIHTSSSNDLGETW